MRFLYIFCFLYFCISCGKPNTDFSIEIVDGVKHVRNHAPAWKDAPKASLEYVRQIGDLEHHDERYQFYMPIDIAIDSEGNLYILEQGNCRISVFDQDGDFLRAFGRKGEGPGEFEEPQYLCIKNDILYVKDGYFGKLIMLDTFGKELKRPVHEGSSYNNVGITDTGRIVSAAFTDSTALAFYDDEGVRYNGFAKIKEYERGEEILASFPRIMNETSLIVSGDIYVVFRSQNRIEKYSSGGDLLFSANRPLNFEESTEMRSEKREVTISEISGETYKSVMEMPMYNRIAIGAGLDHMERIWIAAYLRQRDMEAEESPPDYLHFEIFDSDGILLGCIPLPEKYNNRFRVLGDRIYFVDSYDKMCVYEYRIVER